MKDAWNKKFNVEIPQKIKNWTTLGSTYLTSEYLKNMKILVWKNICPPMFNEALFTIAKIWHNLSAHQQMKK